MSSTTTNNTGKTHKIRISVTNRDLDVLLLIIGILGSAAVWYFGPAKSYIFHLVLWISLIIFYLSWSLFPIDYLLLREIDATSFQLTHFKLGKQQWSKEVQYAGKWWNYTQLPDAASRNLRHEFHPNNPKNTGTGNMNSSGIPTRITLHLKMVDQQDQPIVLYDDLGNWASIPPDWKYNIELAEAATIHICCKQLKKVAKQLSL